MTLSAHVDATKTLAAGIRKLRLTVPPSAQAAMIEFLHLLVKWNKVYNLTAITDINKMITHHLLDSLAIAPYCRGKRILDVGSGAGFPGIPLALAFPEKSLVLLDSSQKKTAFLIQAVATFKITNATVVQARVENFEVPTKSCFETIICRAFGTIKDILKETRHLVCPQGQWLVMKGAYPQEELTGLTPPHSVHVLQVPGLDAKRHVVIIEQQKDDKSRWPTS